MLQVTRQTEAEGGEGPSPALIATIAIATGALIANVYYAQPLIAMMGPELGMKPDLAGSIVSVTQVGYGLGLFFLVSLSDLIENRRLVLIALAGTIIGLIGVGFSTSATQFMAAYFLVGICSTAAQILIPFAAHLVPEARRGRVVGNIMAAVLTAIMLSRPVSLFIAGYLGWRAVFLLSAAVMIAIGLALARTMPKHAPKPGMHYGEILRSMARLLRASRVLRFRTSYQSLMFLAFSIFWTAAPLMLADRFGMSTNGIALFALAGAGGALAAPLAGRIADSGLSLAGTAAAMLMLGVSFFLTRWAVAGSALIVLALLAVILDAAVQMNQVISQRMIFTISPEMRGRLNALYMTGVYLGGAVGSVIGTITYHWGGWNGTAAAGGIIGLLMLALFAVEQSGLKRD